MEIESSRVLVDVSTFFTQNLVPGRLRDGDYAWMGETSVHGNRIEPFSQGVHLTNFPNPKLFGDVSCNDRGAWEYPHTHLSKCFHGGAVFKFPYNLRANSILGKPRIQPSAKRRITRRQKKRSAIQRMWGNPG